MVTYNYDCQGRILMCLVLFRGVAHTCMLRSCSIRNILWITWLCLFWKTHALSVFRRGHQPRLRWACFFATKKTTSGSDLHQSCLTFCEESQEDKIIIFLFVPHRWTSKALTGRTYAQSLQIFQKIPVWSDQNSICSPAITSCAPRTCRHSWYGS